MHELSVIILVLSGGLYGIASTDPCISYSTLPRAEYRGGQCIFQANKEVCDSTLTERWYRAVGIDGDLVMQNSPAELGKCGTKFPYWMNGTHPVEADGEVERHVCQTGLWSNCEQNETVKVINCGSYYVYKLIHVDSCPKGYCFGENDTCPPFDPCDVYEHTHIDYDASRSSSGCGSDGSNCDQLNKVTWYKFKGISGYLNVSTSCPILSSCGTQLPLWINGSVQQHENNTELNTVCVKDGGECCAHTFTIETKTCTDFKVYRFNNDWGEQCQRYCVDDTSVDCEESSTIPESRTTGPDPCVSYSMLPRAEYRGGQCTFKTNKEVCDSTLTERWYRAVGLDGDLVMQDFPAELGKCGTKFPYWMNGTHPVAAEGEVERQVCQTGLWSNCEQTETVNVINCGSYYVYKLKHVDSCPKGYCFGENETCPPFDPCDVYEHTNIDYDASRSSSGCGSDGSNCDQLNKVFWYKFKGISGYLNVSTSCPISSSCGTQLPLWIKGSVQQHENGTEVNTVCVKDGGNCCAHTFTIETKTCTDFKVYRFNNDWGEQCQRYCVDDTSVDCEASSTIPGSRTTGSFSESEHTTDSVSPTYSVGNGVTKISLTVWVIVACVSMTVGATLTGFIVKKVVTKKRKEKVGNSTYFKSVPGKTSNHPYTITVEPYYQNYTGQKYVKRDF